MAANGRNLDENGNLERLRDVDYTAGVAGAFRVHFSKISRFSTIFH